MPNKPPLRVGLAGLGAVGLEVAKRLIAGVPGLTLAAVAVRDADKARRALPELGSIAIKPATALADDCDVVVECLPPPLFREVALSAIDKGRIFMPLSVAQLLDNWDLVERAREKGARILPPTGALIGLDAVRAAAEGTIHSIKMITRKPPGGLEGAPYLRRAQHFGRRPESAAESFRRHGARRRARLSRQRQRGGGAQPRRHRSRPHATGNLGRPDHHAQHAPHRGRRRRRALFHDHRRHSVAEPAHRPHRAAVHHRRAARAGVGAEGGNLTALTRAGKSCGGRGSRRARWRRPAPAHGRGTGRCACVVKRSISRLRSPPTKRSANGSKPNMLFKK